MQSGHGRHGGNQGKTDKHEAEDRGMAESLSGGRDRDEAEGHTSGKD